ncbi:MAG: hypothetical protein DSY77_05095 [Bacteroidetes bacterium]|nr:MAG: hypothetical protein DSY77_05095 [Bacteroidota bacterium]
MNSEIPEIKEWLKNNRNKTINDYYSLYPHQAKESIKTEINSSQLPKTRKWNKPLTWLFLAIFLVSVTFIFRDEIIKAFPITSNLLFKTESNEIQNQLEQAYFEITNLSLLDENNLSETPFYNLDLAERLGMGLGLMLNQEDLSFQPNNFKIERIENKEADIAYDLRILSGEKVVKTVPVQMKTRKIGEKWRFDFDKFLPLEEK